MARAFSTASRNAGRRGIADVRAATSSPSPYLSWPSSRYCTTLVAHPPAGWTPAMRHTVSALLLAVLVSPAGIVDYQARVVGISDGDTITVLRDGRQQR